MTKIKCGDKIPSIGWMLLDKEGNIALHEVFHSREEARFEREMAERIGDWKLCRLTGEVSK